MIGDVHTTPASETDCTGIVEGEVLCPSCDGRLPVFVFLRNEEDCPACGAELGIYAREQ